MAARSGNHCCREKAINITYVLVCVCMRARGCLRMRARARVCVDARARGPVHVRARV